MEVTLEVRGAEVLARELDQAAAALAKPVRPLLQVLSAEMVTYFQEHILQGGGEAAAEAGGWPPLHPFTQGIRRRRGYSAGPLIRKGDLLHSIRELALTEDEVRVGTVHEIAYLVHEGGTESAPYNVPGTRQIPPRPFVLFSSQELEDVEFLIAEYFTEGADVLS
ncbi:MAG TPA: phage virion morphogenesis protein [Thermoanaerobaculia bacterium]|nr:phage virion morphogenesis protein [Thermoanaerobaculia bacterium]